MINLVDEFFAPYLHQDFAREFGSAEKLADELVRTNSSPWIEDLTEGLKALLIRFPSNQMLYTELSRLSVEYIPPLPTNFFRALVSEITRIRGC
ncbi:contact-dependent growth inhibition system immunity protein [Pseudoxanthomonas winnipegensis]|uniref:contact-dependent growth inhibition system immunity protein n=1 Tax=Pseudoxanthomonas winnipegensis TaxID=2480810 RepID=UPI0025790C87|nr:contact-dependent growth inhibition system immunity protein [Pseudoxanthomonas winnipegensis]WJI15896.1 contact-dependent growth inhibition system immunity protein [Pseudoxanthomonas winnipegensis]